MPFPLCVSLLPGAFSAILALSLGAPAACPATATVAAPEARGGEVVWFGPVNVFQSRQSEARYVTCTGNGHPSCADQAVAHRSQLERLTDELHVDAGAPLVLRAFSAGGSAVKRYLDDDGALTRVRVVTLADATYEVTPGTAAPGFVRYGLQCAAGAKLFVATASASPNVVGGPHAMNGAASLAALQAEIERRSGRAFETVHVAGLGEGRRLGACWFFDFGKAYSHEEHATVLAARVWHSVVEPYLAGRASA
jgi:hypothetical protein